MKKFRIWKIDGSTETVEATTIEVIKKESSLDLKFRQDGKVRKISGVTIVTEVHENIIIAKSQIQSADESDD